MRKILSCFAIAVLCFAVFIPAPLRAQSIWLDRSHDKTLGLEVLRPNFKSEGNNEVSGLALFLSLRAPLSQQLSFVSELPFVHSNYASRSIFLRGGSESTIGNPYLGVEIGRKDSPFFGEFGVRLPITSDDKFGTALVGFLTDFDRFEAFIPNTLPITGMLNYHHREASGFALRFRGGPSLLIYTEGGLGDSADLFAGYSAQAGYESERFSLLGGLTGRANLTEEDAGSVHQLGFNASLGLGNVRPGIHFRIPLDDELKESMDFVLGFNLGIQL
jgi:hypothetical protein